MIKIKDYKRFLPACLTLALGLGAVGYSVPRVIESAGIVKDEKEFDSDFSFPAYEEECEKSESTETPEEREETNTLDTEDYKAGLQDADTVLDAVDAMKEDLTTNYHEYIDLVASKIDDVTDKRDIVGDFAIYYTMLSNGYISYGDYEYSHPAVELSTLRGVNVIVGDGVCLNQAHNMADVFEALGYQTKVVVGKAYLKGTEKPEDANHAVVYVSDGKFSYVLDPTNDTIYLRHSNLLYYSIESQEDTIWCFEPSIFYHKDSYGSYNSAELIGDLFNDHKKHWEVLKAYKNYKEAAQAYLDEFKTYEDETLLPYEEYFDEVYTLIYDTFVKEKEENKDVKVKGLSN